MTTLRRCVTALSVFGASVAACGGKAEVAAPAGSGGTAAAGGAADAGLTDVLDDTVVPVWGLDTVPSSCPDASGGPALVPIRGGYCIDATEVTRGQYESWLASAPSPAGQPPECGWNTDFAPDPACMNPDVEYPALPACSPPEDCTDHPQVCVDWCDAFAYCKGVGKRLCGAIGGGAEVDSSRDAAGSQWYNVCSSGGMYEYPYGSQRQEDWCNDSSAYSLTTAVGHLPRCQSQVDGYRGVYDLVGNADEWVDWCGLIEGDWKCTARGGAWENWYDSCGWWQTAARTDHSTYIGFRCCAP